MMRGQVVSLRPFNGYYVMARGWMNHPMFPSEPLCKRAAWLWLIENAGFRPRKVRLDGKEITLKRGQLIASVRHLATEWGWAPTRVHRFLKKLNRHNATGTAGATVGETAPRIITICNYDKYQATPSQGETATVVKPEQERIKEESPYGKGSDELPRNGAIINPTVVIFGQCLAYLTQNGVPEKKARSLLGKWRKEYGEGNVIEVASEASRQGISEPVAWIEKALRVRHGSREGAPEKRQPVTSLTVGSPEHEAWEREAGLA